MAAATARMTADDLASDFYARGMEDRWLSAKQAQFLLRLFQDAERRRRGSAPRNEASGHCEAQGKPVAVWEIHCMGNGAAIFRVRPLPTQSEMAAQDREQERSQKLRSINEQIWQARKTGDMDEVDRLLDESAALMANTPGPR